MKKFGWIAFLGSVLITSCGKSIPDEIIPPAKMENILYDYHLSLGISSKLPSSEDYKKQAYKNYLFIKHQITEEQFDSSMVWYTRNAYQLSNIYQKLEKRLNKDKSKLNTMLEEREIDITTPAGDTVSIWYYDPVYWLTNKPLNNKLSFSINADENFWIQDAFQWKANVTFLTPGEITMGFNIHLNNDSIIGKTISVSRSGSCNLFVQTDTINDIKNVYGFIQIHNDSINQTPSAIISNVSLTKYHTTEEKEEKEKDEQEKELKLDNDIKPLRKDMRNLNNISPNQITPQK